MIVEFSVFPISGPVGKAKAVSRIIDIIDKSGLPYKTHSMGTVVEGEWDEIFILIKKCHSRMRKDHPRIYTIIHIDDRKGAKNRLRGKVDDIEKILKRSICRNME